jgi:hypothetical protein
MSLLRSCELVKFAVINDAGHRMGNSCEFRYVSGWEIRGHLRERSGFAAICVEMEGGCSGFGKDHE